MGKTQENKTEKDSNNKLYKNKYHIVFYDKNGEDFRYCFKNVQEILRFQKKPITKETTHMLYSEIYRVLRKGDNNLCTFLNGETMRLYIMDLND